MALQLEHAYWREEIIAAQEVMRPYLGEAYDQMVLNYTGGRHGQDDIDRDPDENDPENHAFEWIALMQGQAIPGVPQTKAESLIPEDPVLQQEASQLQLALNELSTKTNLRRELFKLFVDYSMRWGVGLVKPKPTLGAYQFEDPPEWPQVMRLSLRDWVCDVRALDAETRRWAGHRVRLDLEDVMDEALEDEDSGWNLEWLRQVETRESDESGTDGNGLRPRIRRGSGPDRKQVEVFEVWVPELELEFTDEDAKRTGKKSWVEAGYNGLILTISTDTDEETRQIDTDEPWPRVPRPFFGPPCGPYQFFQGYFVPDDGFPLSAIGAVEGQMEFLNDLVRAMNKSARRYKRVVFVSSEDPELAINVTEGEHDGVYTTNVGDLKKGIQEATIGGPSNEQIVTADIAKERLNKASGLDDAQRGNVTGQGTATEVLAATQASAARVSGTIIGNFREGMLGLYRKMAWYVWNSPTFKMLVAPSATPMFRPDGQQIRGGVVVRGGSPRLNEDTGELEAQAMAPNFDAVSIQIHTFSLQSFGTTSPQQQLMEFDTAAMAYLPMVSDPRFLCVGWRRFFGERRRLVQGPDFSESIDFDLAAQIAAVQLQQQVEQAQPDTPQNKPTGGGQGNGPGWRVTMKGGPQPSEYARGGGLLKAGSNVKNKKAQASR